MLNLTSKKTISIIEHILDNPIFKQTDVHSKLKVSVGQVNKVIKWLIERDYIVKEQGRFYLQKPNKLVSLIAYSILFKKSKEFNIDLSSQKTIELLKKNDAVFCLGSALEKSDEISCYENDSAGNQLSKISRGRTKIVMYKTELPVNQNISKTSIVRTIIDYTALGREKEVEDLALKKWGTLQ